jgi:hypothetical protein
MVNSPTADGLQLMQRMLKSGSQLPLRNLNTQTPRKSFLEWLCNEIAVSEFFHSFHCLGRLHATPVSEPEHRGTCQGKGKKWEHMSTAGVASQGTGSRPDRL